MIRKTRVHLHYIPDVFILTIHRQGFGDKRGLGEISEMQSQDRFTEEEGYTYAGIVVNGYIDLVYC